MRTQENENSFRALWSAVLLQALIDLQSSGKKDETQRAKSEALCWIDEENEDFIEVCGMANIMPEHFIKKAKRIKNNNKLIRIKQLAGGKPSKRISKKNKKSSWREYEY